MDVQSNFNFDDFDFDFLATASSKPDATDSSSSIEIASSGQPQKKICKYGSSSQIKRSRLAERICNTDLVVKQLADLQQSAKEITHLYEVEKQNNIQNELKFESCRKENDELRNELEDWKLKCDQFEARIKENLSSLKVIELVNGYVRVAQKLSDTCSYNALHKRDIINLNKLKTFCIDNHISSFKRTSGVPKDNKSVECLLWTTNPDLVKKPDTCTRATQCGSARTQEQSTQYKTYTLSSGTMTTLVPPVERIDAATNFPEPKELPPLHEILRNSIKAWDINPISPLRDPPETHTKDIEPINPIMDQPVTHRKDIETTNPINISLQTHAKEIQPTSQITDSPDPLAIKINIIDPNNDSPELQELNPIIPVNDSSESQELNQIITTNAPPEQEELYPIIPVNTSSESQKLNLIIPSNAPPLAHPQELVKETKTVGTCTVLCNVLTSIDKELELPKIKSCNSRPPSRSMINSVKDEMTNLDLPYGGLKDFFNEKLLSSKSFGESSSIPNFTPDMFEELWQLFGQMVLGLLQRRFTHPNTRKDEFNNWLPQMYEACKNFEHEISLQKSPISVPCSSATSKNYINDNHTNQEDYQHSDYMQKTKSIGTSPTKPSELENSVIDDEKEHKSDNEKTSDNIDIRRIRLFSDRSIFRPIDSEDSNPKIIKLSNTTNANTAIDETAVNFLSSLSAFKNVCVNSLEDLDDDEMDLLASASCPLLNYPPQSQIDLENTSLESNEDTEYTVIGSEVDMEANTESDVSIVNESTHSIDLSTDSDTSISEITDRSPEILTESDSEEEDDIFDNLIIDDSIPSVNSNDNLNMDCSAKSEKLVQQQNEIKNNSTSHVCDLSTINELFGDIPKPLEETTRKRKRKLDASQYSLNPCKRSARLAEKRLLVENKSLFDTPLIIGKYTSPKYKQDDDATRNFHDPVKNKNCDKPNPLLTTTITGSTLSKQTYAPNVPDFFAQRSETFFLTNNLQPNVTPTSTTASISGYAENANHYNNLRETQLNDVSEHKELSICVDSVDDLESPSSPQPSTDYDKEQFKNNSLPIQIPLNLCKSAETMGSRSLLEILLKKERQNMTKVNKKAEICEENLIREMYTKIIEHFQSPKQYDSRNLCYDLQKISLKVDLCISALLDSATLKLFGNSQEQSINTKYINVLHNLQEIYPEFLTQFLSKLDVKLFTFNQNKKPTLSESLNLLKIYLATIQLQAAMPARSEFTNPARIIVAKILYFFQKDMPRLVYEVLCLFPTVLPHRDEKTYDHSDPLITVIKHELMKHKYDMYNEELCSRQLLSKLRFEYHFEIYKPMQQDVLNQLIGKLEAGQLKHLQLSFAVFCKRMFVPHCLKEVINGRLLPLVNKYYDLAKLSSEYDERIAVLFTCMSTVIKSFVLETDVSACMSVFKRYLFSIKRPCVQEAAVQAIIRLQRFGFISCTEALKEFMPSYTLQPLTVAMLRSLAQRRLQYKITH